MAQPQAEEERLELAELLAEVRRIEVLGRRLVDDAMAGGYHSVFRGSGIEFHDVRAYTDGDDVRSIDWNVTARTGRPFVKRYVDERERTVLFVVDLSASMTGGYGAWSGRHMAARVCACLAMSAARNDDRAGLVAFSDGVDTWLPPRKGLSHVLRIVRDLLVLPGHGGRTELASALDFVHRAVRGHAVVFVVSDFLADGWGDALARCGRRHDVVAVRIGSPELDAPPRGLARVVDPETRAVDVVDLASPRVRAAWQARVRAWRERTDEAFRQARVDHMDVPVPLVPDRDAVAGPILRFFRMREQRSAKR